MNINKRSKRLKNRMLLTQERYIKNKHFLIALIAISILWLIFAFFEPISLFLFFITAFYILPYQYYKVIKLKVGYLGEKKVIEQIEMPFSVLLTNVVLPGKKWDIDHILVSPWGIFVIETKNYRSGYIIVNGDKWERIKIREDGSSCSLYIGNPSKQVKFNARDVQQFLKSTLKKEYPVKPILLFVGNAKVFGKSTVPILTLRTLKSYVSNREIALDIEEVIKIGNTLLPYSRHVKINYLLI